MPVPFSINLLPMHYEATFLAYQVSTYTGFVSERYSVSNKSDIYRASCSSIFSSKTILTIFKTSLLHVTIRIGSSLYQQVQLNRKKKSEIKTITFADDKGCLIRKLERAERKPIWEKKIIQFANGYKIYKSL